MIAAALVAAGCAAYPAAHPVQLEVGEQNGIGYIQAYNALVRYRFSEDGGVLSSAFLHFTTLQDRATDAVPGWEGEGDQVSFTQGAARPFELWIDGPDTARVTHEASVLEHDAAEAVVQLRGAGEGWDALKTFTVKHDTLYTMDVKLDVQAPGSNVQLVLGHLPRGRDAPDLKYIYDGVVRDAPQPAGTYGRFEGIGLVGNRVIYFLRFNVPQDAKPFQAVNPAGQLVFGLEIEEVPEAFTLSGTLFAGRNRYLILEAAGLEELVSVGLFSQFLVYVMRFLSWLYELTGNYVWAIFLFTLLTRVILYPFMRTQLRSMAKMQRLQPKIKKLQERYKDDRATQQKQMVELYRQEKVNPLGGCLPMLLQFPLLILLWQAILYSAEKIRLSPGFLWITDLSQPDPFYILVIVTTGLMLLQQWLTQRRMASPATGGSQAIGWLFPIIMAVLFLGWPAGLWMYWLFTTVFQVGQQWLVDREIARESVGGAMARTADTNDNDQDGTEQGD